MRDEVTSPNRLPRDGLSFLVLVFFRSGGDDGGRGGAAAGAGGAVVGLEHVGQAAQ